MLTKVLDLPQYIYIIIKILVELKLEELPRKSQIHIPVYIISQAEQWGHVTIVIQCVFTEGGDRAANDEPG